MALGKIEKVIGGAVPVLGDDIDTDRIIPARFLKCVTFDALGAQLFYDVRYDDNGKSIGHPIDDAKYKGASIIVSGNNFGCGSSREHAPQAIKKAGFNAVIAGSYAEIFFGNCTTLGIVCVEADDATRAGIVEAMAIDASAQMEIDVEACKVSVNGKSFDVAIKENARAAFLAGNYDSLADLLGNMDDVKKLEASLKYSFTA
ncbi:MAG: 3-isopropylmalate dehydratase small subunit [Denitrovibrio sp.]|nr:MAG: 3-isopropylmalate dehydratase small subunit [Denitrovibrio sp.]